jgi:hypothetical protein
MIVRTNPARRVVRSGEIIVCSVGMCAVGAAQDKTCMGTCMGVSCNYCYCGTRISLAKSLVPV